MPLQLINLVNSKDCKWVALQNALTVFDVVYYYKTSNIICSPKYHTGHTNNESDDNTRTPKSTHGLIYAPASLANFSTDNGLSPVRHQTLNESGWYDTFIPHDSHHGWLTTCSVKWGIKSKLYSQTPTAVCWWISTVIPPFIMGVFTYPCCD